MEKKLLRTGPNRFSISSVATSVMKYSGMSATKLTAKVAEDGPIVKFKAIPTGTETRRILIGATRTVL